MPSPLHYLPFAHRDWLSSSRVRRMPLAAQGAYLTLLCYQWEDGGLPAAPEDVAGILGLTPKEIAPLWRHLEPAFPIGADGERRNPRMTADREEAYRKVTRNRLNGALGGRRPAPQPELALEPAGDPSGDPNGEPNGSPSVTQGEPERCTGTEPIPEPDPESDSEPAVPCGAGSDSVFERVRETLDLVAEGTGTARPTAARVREWRPDRRRLAPLLREIEPREAAELYLWCGRHFSGGRSWGLIHDNLGVLRQQMRGGVASVPRASPAPPSSRSPECPSPMDQTLGALRLLEQQSS